MWIKRLGVQVPQGQATSQTLSQTQHARTTIGTCAELAHHPTVVRTAHLGSCKVQRSATFDVVDAVGIHAPAKQAPQCSRVAASLARLKGNDPYRHNRATTRANTCIFVSGCPQLQTTKASASLTKRATGRRRQPPSPPSPTHFQNRPATRGHHAHPTQAHTNGHTRARTRTQRQSRILTHTHSLLGWRPT